MRMRNEDVAVAQLQINKSVKCLKANDVVYCTCTARNFSKVKMSKKAHVCYCSVCKGGKSWVTREVVRKHERLYGQCLEVQQALARRKKLLEEQGLYHVSTTYKHVLLL